MDHYRHGVKIHDTHRPQKIGFYTGRFLNQYGVVTVPFLLLAWFSTLIGGTVDGLSHLTTWDVFPNTCKNHGISTTNSNWLYSWISGCHQQYVPPY